MEHDLKIHQPEIKSQQSESDFELTENVIQRHLTNRDDKITDEDIKNVRIDLGQDEDNDKSMEKRGATEKNATVNDEDDISPLWNIFS